MAVLRKTLPQMLVSSAFLAPLFLLLYGFFRDSLGPNPVEKITHETGQWTLRLLLATLAVTPLRRCAGMPWLIRFRRTLGLLAFFYGLLHLLTYVWLDQFFDWKAMGRDILKRRFITAGMMSFLAMVPLALTSTRGWIVRLGGKGWQRLHRLVYLAAAAGVVHFWWLVKSDIREPALYGAVLALLMLARLKKKGRQAPRAPVSTSGSG
ncbi:MAG: sulfoxide reductase heme-binding subunit YedZ [Bryobacteraceae bacterium]|nr:sulfoxide reductase heme-binding subunit YedZ [Bryobacteraceae bacterium]